MCIKTMVHVVAASLAVSSAAVRAQVAADDSIAAALMAGGDRFETSRTILWVESGSLTPGRAREFSDQLEDGVAAIEQMLGRSLDSAHYGGTKIQVFVGTGIGISHVYGSYDHMKYDRPFLYLDAEKVATGEAPYLHEATHLMAWRFGSHSLREGLASYVEAELRSRSDSASGALFGASSPEAVDRDASERLESRGAVEVLPWIGRTGFAPASITSPERPRIRATYYVLSQSFAQYLIEAIGLQRFLAVYESDDAERELLAVSGDSLEAWKDRWKAALQDVRIDP